MARDRAARELVGALTALDAARHRPAARRAFAQSMARLVRAAATLSAGQHRCVVAAKPGRWGSARASKERTVDDRCRYRISYLLHAQSARRKSLCASLRAPRHPQLSREQSRSHGQRDATGQQEVVGVGTQEFGGDHHAPRGPHHDGSDEQRPSPSGVPQVRRPGTPQEPLVQPAQGCANIHVGMMPRSPIRAVVPSAAAGTVTLSTHTKTRPPGPAKLAMCCRSSRAWRGQGRSAHAAIADGHARSVGNSARLHERHQRALEQHLPVCGVLPRRRAGRGCTSSPLRREAVRRGP